MCGDHLSLQTSPLVVVIILPLFFLHSLSVIKCLCFHKVNLSVFCGRLFAPVHVVMSVAVSVTMSVNMRRARGFLAGFWQGQVDILQLSIIVCGWRRNSSQ